MYLLDWGANNINMVVMLDAMRSGEVEAVQ